MCHNKISFGRDLLLNARPLCVRQHLAGQICRPGNNHLEVEMTMKKRIVLFSMGAAALTLVGCASGEKAPLDSTRSAQVVCEEAVAGCEGEVDGAVTRLKELEAKCAADVQAACTAKGDEEPDAKACEAAATACSDQLEALANSQADMSKTCADKIESSCKSDEAQSSPSDPSPPSAACSMAQDSCRSNIAGLSAKQEGLHTTCRDDIQAACEGGQSESCDKAIAGCSEAVKAAQSEAEGIVANCAQDVEKACLDESQAAPSATSPPTGTPPVQTPPTGPSAECTAAQNACVASHDGLAEKSESVEKACSEAVAKGCGPQAKEEDCKAAHDSCQAGYEGLQKGFADNGQACEGALEKACVPPDTTAKP